MADGLFRSPPVVHEDGVYLGLPEHAYLADRALSASAFKKLLANPPDWWWEHASNPLYEPPFSDARALGTAAHKAVLEGLHAYEATYCAEPDPALHPGVLDTQRDLQAWIERANAEIALAGELNDKGKPLKFSRSGTKPELVERVREIAERFGMAAQFWEEIRDAIVAGRTVMRPKDDLTVRLVEGFIRRDPQYAKLLSGGLPEVTVFWTEEREIGHSEQFETVRCKARLDYLRATAIVDLKTFGQSYQRGLVRGVLADRVAHGDTMQAVHATRAVEAAQRFLEQGRVVGSSTAELDTLAKILPGKKAFVWLCVRVGGAPTAIAPRFDDGTIPWGVAVQQIDEAMDAFCDYRRRFGDEMWVRSEGVMTPDITEWPSWMVER